MDPQHPDLPVNHQETMPTISSKMESSIPEDVQLVTLKMDNTLNDLKYLSNLISRRSVPLMESVQKQRTIQDVKNNIDRFNQLFKVISNSLQANKQAFDSVTNLILSDFSSIENESNSSLVNNPSCKIRNDSVECCDNPIDSAVEDIKKLSRSLNQKESSAQDDNHKIPNSEEEALTSRLGKASKNSQYNIIGNRSQPSHSENKLLSALPSSYDTVNSYDSSNDLPEAKANLLAASKQMPYSSNMNDSTNCEQSANNEDQSDDKEPDENNSQVTEPPHVSSTHPESVEGRNHNADESCPNLKLSQNKEAISNSQLSESLLLHSSPALLEKLQDRSTEDVAAKPVLENTLGETHQAEPEVQDALINSDRNDKTSGAVNVGPEDPSRHENEPNMTASSSRMNSLSKKVNDWLNQQDSQPNVLLFEKVSDFENEKDISEIEDNDDDQTEIFNPSQSSRDGKTKPVDGLPGVQADSENESQESIEDDNKSLLATNISEASASTTIINDGKGNKSRRKVPKPVLESDEIIEISDESNEKLNIKRYPNNSNSSIAPVEEKSDEEKEEDIELVDLNDQDSDVCVIESSQGSGKLTPTKSHGRPSNSISDTSECETQIGNGIQGSKTRTRSNLNSKKLGDSSENDEAKRKLLEGSSSSSDSLKSALSDSNSISDSTVIIKRKKMKMKKRKRKSDRSSGCSSGEKSADSEEEVKKLLDLHSLKKRKIVEESNGSESENASSGSVRVRRRKKKSKKAIEDDPVPFSDVDSTCSNQKLEDDEAFFRDASPSSPNNFDDHNATNELCKDLLLNSASSGSESESSSPIDKVNKTKRKKSGSEMEKENSDGNSFLAEDSGKKKKKRKYDPLLHGNFTLTSSDSASEKNKISPSQKSRLDDERYQKLLKKKRKAEEKEEERCSTQEDVNSSNEDESMELNLEESSEGEHQPIRFVSCDPECVEISEDDDFSGFEDDEGNCRTRPSIHQMSPSEDEENPNIPLSQETISSKTGRKNIKKIISSAALTQETKQAAKEEEERRKRISEKEKIMSQARVESEVGKLVLDFDKDTNQPLVTVHPLLVEVLKEHQIEGLKFMWNTCFESIKQTTSTKGSGCVLAHCMGLGKSLQIVTLVHTIIKHPELNMKNILITCPKSVVLNWSDEFRKWLQKIESNDFDSRKVRILNLLDFKDNAMKEKRLKDWHENGGVMIMSYTSFRTLATLGQKGKDIMFTSDETSANINNEAGPSSKSSDNAASLAVYDQIRKYLVNPGPDVIVCDEGHTLKNDLSGIHKAVDQVETRRRIVLTGTPMQNNLLEYYYMVNLVKPSYLGDKKEFRNRFFNPIDNGQYNDSTPQDVKIMKSRAHVLYKKLDGIVHRCDVNMFKDQVPPRFEYVLKLRLTKLQIKLYEAYISEVKGMSESQEAAAEGISQTDTRLLLKSDAILSNIVNHPMTLTLNDGGNAPEGEGGERNEWRKCLQGFNLEDVKLSPKTVLFFEILEKCQEQGDKLLVFSQHLKLLDLLEHFLQKSSSRVGLFNKKTSEKDRLWIKGLDYFRLDGKTTTLDRKSFIERFNNPRNKRGRLFLLSSKAGGVGVNLTGANRAIVFDVSWNPSVDSQSVFRIYRFGQQKSCYIYRFVAKGTMEEKKYNRQVSKLSTSSRVVDNWQVNRHYKESYLKALYNYDFNYDAEPRQTLKVPADKALAEMLKIPDCIDTYDETDVLLQNIVGEELDEEERRKAWEDYENEKNNPTPAHASTAPPPNLPSLQPGDSVTSANVREQMDSLRRRLISMEKYAAGGSNSSTDHSSSKLNKGPLDQDPTPRRRLNKTWQPPSTAEVKDAELVRDLLRRNIIPLHYEPLRPPQSSSCSNSAKTSESNASNNVTKNSGTSNESTMHFESRRAFLGKIDPIEAQKENSKPNVNVLTNGNILVKKPISATQNANPVNNASSNENILIKKLISTPQNSKLVNNASSNGNILINKPISTPQNSKLVNKVSSNGNILINKPISTPQNSKPVINASLKISADQSAASSTLINLTRTKPKKPSLNSLSSPVDFADKYKNKIVEHREKDNISDDNYNANKIACNKSQVKSRNSSLSNLMSNKPVKSNAKDADAPISVHKSTLKQLGSTINRLPQATVSVSKNSTLTPAGTTNTANDSLAASPSSNQAFQAGHKTPKVNRKANKAATSAKVDFFSNESLVNGQSFSKVNPEVKQTACPPSNFTRKNHESRASLNSSKMTPKAAHPPCPPPLRTPGNSSSSTNTNPKATPLPSKFTAVKQRAHASWCAQIPSPSTNQMPQPTSNFTQPSQTANHTARVPLSFSSNSASGSAPVTINVGSKNLKDILEDLQNFQKVVKEDPKKNQKTSKNVRK